MERKVLVAILMLINPIATTDVTEVDISKRVDQALEMINTGARIYGRTIKPIKGGRLVAVRNMSSIDLMQYGDGFALGLDSWQRVGPCVASYGNGRTSITIRMPIGLRFFAAVFPSFHAMGRNMSAYCRIYRNSFDVSLTIRRRLDCFSVEAIDFYADDVILFSSDPNFDNVNISMFFGVNARDFIIDSETFTASKEASDEERNTIVHRIAGYGSIKHASLVYPRLGSPKGSGILYSRGDVPQVPVELCTNLLHPEI